MALITWDITENFAAGKELTQTLLHETFLSAETFGNYANNNLLQILRDAGLYGVTLSGGGTYNFDNDGVANLTNTLYDKQLVTDTDTGDTSIATVGAWTDVDASDSIITLTPEIAGSFLALFAFNLKVIPSNATNVTDVMFRLISGTSVASYAVPFRLDNYGNGLTHIQPFFIPYHFSMTAVSSTVRLQYYITTATNVALTVTASATTPTYMQVHKI